MKFKTIRETTVSPDGKLVAYVVREALMEKDKSEYLSHIWVAATDGSFNVQYTQGEKSCTSPAFCPAGKCLAFLSKRNNKTQVWIMRVNGGEAQQITEADEDISSFKWAPDGNRIAYVMQDPETSMEKEQKEGKSDVILIDQNYKYRHLYVIDMEKDKEGKLNMKQLTGGAFSVYDFDWSPDGKFIAFAHVPDPTINTLFISGDISVVPSDSGEIRKLVSWEGRDNSPHYSPDGKWIAFVSNGGKPEPTGLGDVFIIPAFGGKAKKLVQSPDRSADIIGWKADGKSIFISETVQTTNQIIEIPCEGEQILFPLSTDRKSPNKKGTFSNISLSRDGLTFAFTYQETLLIPQVYISAADRFDKKDISKLNQFIVLPEMGRTEIISWKSFDGLLIQGLLTYPKDYENGTKYPVILLIHGGPAGVFTQSFTGNPNIYMEQYFAGKGFFILKPNPRGSTGYGKEFRYANFQDWGYGDYEDLMSGVDYVINQGLADPDKQFVMGWSYGGYMTSFIVTRTDRFKAASMGAGLPNLISMFSTTDIPDFLAGHFGGEFWENYDLYEKHSAIYHIENVKTPTQVMHGEKDLRVPFTQGQEFYVSLKRLGVPTEMIVYPRTPHGPQEPKLLMDVSQRVFTWFEKYLD
jgi:dipeptidyl aminopeptidase/acylaminoacyl peptidase